MLTTFRHILRSRSLLATLTVRELKARYRGSVLGFFWSLVNPLLLLGVYSFVFGMAFRPARGSAAEPYALFLICGLFPWIWVASSLNEGVVSLATHSGLIRKAAFPAELLPLVAVLGNGAHFLLALPILGAALAVGRALGYAVGGLSCLLLPVVVLLELALLSGLALGLAALYVHFKDLKDIVANLLTLFFFLTPILYSLEAIPVRALSLVVRVNPVTPFILAYQQLLFYGQLPGVTVWLQMLGAALAACALGGWVFHRLRDTLVEAV
ncbi:MAG TPA: ABC transporter permease [Thermoanaerobaculia bacterium]|nr:ABC transporter permease [Thermoanaerobaculia bacterium]